MPPTPSASDRVVPPQCKRLQLDKSGFHVLGTPAQLKAWCATWASQPRTSVAFTIEGTLLMPGTLAPIKRNLAYLDQLRTQGHMVLLTGCAATPSAARRRIVSQLAALRVSYDRLVWSAPDVDLYVGATVVDALQSDLATQIGFYPTALPATGEAKAPGGAAPSTQLSLTQATALAAVVGLIGLAVGRAR